MLFGEQEEFQSLIYPHAFIDKEALQANPKCVEQFIRTQALDALEVLGEKMLQCKKDVSGDVVAAEMAFGPEGVLTREMYWVGAVCVHLKQSVGVPTLRGPAIGLWAYDLDKALASMEGMAKVVDIQIDNSILMKKVQYIPMMHNVMHRVNLPPTQKGLSIIAFHHAFVDAYNLLLAIEHSFERKQWTYESVEALKKALELHMSEEWDGSLVPRTYSIVGVGPVNTFPNLPYLDGL